MKLFTYDFVGPEWKEDEKQFVVDVLLDPRGWKSQGYLVVPRDSMPKAQRPKKPDFTMRIMEQRSLARLYPDFQNLSLTDMTRWPRKIIYNGNNWNNIPKASKYETLEGYRTYLVNHEVGHAMLSKGHETCKTPGGPAPVMMQQTRGVGKCYPYPWLV